jgi:hypothetical protein
MRTVIWQQLHIPGVLRPATSTCLLVRWQKNSTELSAGKIHRYTKTFVYVSLQLIDTSWGLTCASLNKVIQSRLHRSSICVHITTSLHNVPSMQLAGTHDLIQGIEGQLCAVLARTFGFGQITSSSSLRTRHQS